MRNAVSFFGYSLEQTFNIPATIEDLLQEYDDIFQEPKNLPPIRPSFDHIIPLKEGSNPINQRPCHYSAAQKTIIARLIDEMLAQGFLQQSNSHYASLAVLVGKKDGSWRLGVDYR